eukprot:gnl/MRDRNA2_/MRDRNA2_91982_c0_seq1.p1 gnl/MRDRNA2_/MRDRNA2_91982_c0~~gnl/MRDRNA2_/MRDRNA2_91982_c0_seq1.p1  ORF type:complete len:376 (-),score=103.66 gnl/MRDRNA2_/MRDRNA2_91982_c0_seq1:371-1498(-)
MWALVLLAICTQAWAAGSYVALLQTTVLHQTVRNYADRHTLDSTVEQTKQLVHLLDVDRDGKVSREEVNTFATANGLDPTSIADEFAGVDANRNGILEQEEIASLLGSSPEQEDKKVSKAPSIAASDTEKTVVEGPASAPNLPVIENPGKAPLLKVPNGTSFTATEVKPKLKEQPAEDGVEEYFAEVPVATVQENKSTRTAQHSGNDKAAKVGAAAKKSQSKNIITNSDTQYLTPEASVEGSDSTPEMLISQGNARSTAPAVSAAQKLAEQLNSEVAQTAQSMTFKAAASTLRANASAILIHAQLEARAAAQREATEVTMKNVKEINKLEARAAKAEMRAAALRARATVEMKEAYAAVAVASSSMSKMGAKDTTA